MDNLNYNDQSIVLPRRCEFRVSVEDLTLRVLTTSASYNMRSTVPSERRVARYMVFSRKVVE